MDRNELENMSNKPLYEGQKLQMWVDCFGSCRDLTPFSSQEPLIPYEVFGYRFESPFIVYLKIFSENQCTWDERNADWME